MLSTNATVFLCVFFFMTRVFLLLLYLSFFSHRFCFVLFCILHAMHRMENRMIDIQLNSVYFVEKIEISKYSKQIEETF